MTKDMKMASFLGSNHYFSLPFDGSFMDKTFYTKSNGCINAVRIKDVAFTPRYTTFPDGSCRFDCFMLHFRTTIKMEVATERGIQVLEFKENKMPYIYETPQDAAKGTRRIVNKERLPWLRFGAILVSAMESTPIFDDVVIEDSDGLTEIYYYKWNGTNAEKKYLNMEGHETIHLSKDGCHFENEREGWESLKDTYTSKEECERNNAIKVFEFTD